MGQEGNHISEFKTKFFRQIRGGGIEGLAINHRAVGERE